MFQTYPLPLLPKLAANAPTTTTTTTTTNTHTNHPGTIPTQIGELTMLTQLNLQMNELNGKSIP